MRDNKEIEEEEEEEEGRKIVFKFFLNELCCAMDEHLPWAQLVFTSVFI